MTRRKRGKLEFFEDVKGPFLGLDVGDVRIGVAVSDPEAALARPLATVRREPLRECLIELERLMRETDAAGAVAGLPLLESGEEGDQARRTREFVRSLVGRVQGLRVAWWDERYTSKEADDLRRELGEGRDEADRREDRRGRATRDRTNARSRRDELAAALLLQEWLDERRRRSRRAGSD